MPSFRVLKWFPTNRDIQCIVTAFWLHVTSFGGVFLCLILMLMLLLSKYWWIGVLYLTWMLIDDVPHRGGRMWRYLKETTLFSTSRDYYPAKLIKTVDLDPSKNYIFANFPHGLICVGAFLTFLNDVTGFSKIFPGMTPRMMIHHYFFYVPFYRDIIGAFSVIPSSERSIKHLLNEEFYKGNCVVGVFGGAREGLESEPGRHKLLLDKHKGFVRIAIQTGASLVPVYSFGEVELFRKAALDNSFLYRLQHWLLDATGIMFVRMGGKGFLGLVPLKRPLNVVVGEPMEVKKNPNPTIEEINSVHAQFKEKLIHLFEKEKPKYIENHENTFLEFVSFDKIKLK